MGEGSLNFVQDAKICAKKKLAGSDLIGESSENSNRNIFAVLKSCHFFG